MTEPKPILVIIRSLEGKFLSGDGGHWEFTDDPAKARVFDYLKDRISDQLETMRKKHGLVWAPVPVDPTDRYETCDQCGGRIVCRDAYFNGTSYICRKCREAGAAKPTPVP
jgi:hypothetical protein